MKTRSAKNKGARLQKFVGNEFARVYSLEYGQDKDICGRVMGDIGTDVVMSELTKRKIPYDIECKNCEKWNLEKFWEQTISNTKENRQPLLVIKKNHIDPLIVITFKDFIEILDKNNKNSKDDLSKIKADLIAYINKL